MTKGIPWTNEEMRKLMKLMRANTPVNVIAELMGRSREAVLQKISRSGMKVVVDERNREATTTKEMYMPKELPNVEEALKIQVAALNALRQQGLPTREISRLRAIVNGIKIYKELLADYLDYCGLETRLIEAEEKYRLLIEREKEQPP